MREFWTLFHRTTLADQIATVILFGVVALLVLLNLYINLPWRDWRDHLGLTWLREALQAPLPPNVTDINTRRKLEGAATLGSRKAGVR